ncbi:MAG: Glu/Leu/Phe/Val dehydrogenase [Azospirillaceae bacterium]|nr:Glu/Leu/Phe/Val dehydrogenase [Azospirillaceae bacterium]
MLFDAPDFDNHELVLFGRDPESGLKAIIAVHDTTMGPACGGCRMWPYATEADAVKDVLRLSRGMSYKNVMAGLPLGGGKSVLIGDPKTAKSDGLFRAFGRMIESLGGRYIAAEDVGITVADVQVMGRETSHVAGLNHGAAASGDPSPFTAYGVYLGIKAAVSHRLGTDSLKGVRVAVQGLGNVGSNLCQRLADDGAILTVSDIFAEQVGRAVERFGATAVDPALIHAQDVDVFAPCALGGVLNDQSLGQLKAKVVAGGANNQLAVDAIGRQLRSMGVLYAPDYVINGGGIINVAGEVGGAYAKDAILAKVEAIHGTLADIFRRADAQDRPTNEVADQMARERLAAGRAKGMAKVA